MRFVVALVAAVMLLVGCGNAQKASPQVCVKLQASQVDAMRYRFDTKVTQPKGVSLQRTMYVFDVNASPADGFLVDINHEVVKTYSQSGTHKVQAWVQITQNGTQSMVTSAGCTLTVKT